MQISNYDVINTAVRDMCRPLQCDQSCEVAPLIFANNTVDYQAYCVCDLNFMKIRVAGRFKCNSLNECNYNNGHCEQKCTDLPIGYQCSCENGFTLETNRRSCTRVSGHFSLSICIRHSRI